MLMAAVVAAAGATSCTGDCSLLGDCIDGVCHCDVGWAGEDCAVLSLLPPAPAGEAGGGGYIAPGGYSSWGMSIFRDHAGDGQYHGFVSEFEYGCSLDTWATNSYVNHVVAPTPNGPFKQAGVALPVWAHNPKVVWDAAEKVWVMYHIGYKNQTRAVNCSREAASAMHPPPRPRAPAASSGGRGAGRPFEIHYATSLNGPWIPLAEESSPKGVGTLLGAACSSLLTAYPGADNGAGNSTQETPTTTAAAGVRNVGLTQDASGCRGACAVDPNCTSYTWRPRPGAGASRLPSGDWADAGRGLGDCLLRSDFIWLPTIQAQDPKKISGDNHQQSNTGARVTSGRPWHFGGDNPAPLVDPATGEVTVLYRTDSKGGNRDGRQASLIGTHP